MEDLREENYNSYKCQECNAPVESAHRNDKLEDVTDKFVVRKDAILTMMDWVDAL